MITRRHWGSGLLAALLLIGGCAVTPHFEKPTLSVRGIDVESANFAEQHLRVRVQAHNPNGIDLPIRAIDYSWVVGGEPMGQGQTDAPFVVPAHGDAEFSMHVTIRLGPVLARLLPKLKDGGHGIDYRIEGTVHTGLAWFREFPFSEQGKL